MKKLRKKGFTLIELIAVLVILAILALIVTPLVMNIVKKAKDASNRRSVDAYGKSMELAVATYLLDNGDYPDSLDNLTVEYSGNEVTCNTKILNEDGSIYLSGCSVKNTEVLDSNNSDGYYHYGKTDQVTLNVEYKMGDIVLVNGLYFYVMYDSDSSSDTVTLIKSNALNAEDVSKYQDRISESYIEKDESSNTERVKFGSSVDYDSSIVKQMLTYWSEENFDENELVQDSTGYSVRLLNIDELTDYYGFEVNNQNTSYVIESSESTPDFIKLCNVKGSNGLNSHRSNYWIMSTENYGANNVYTMMVSDSNTGLVSSSPSKYYAVRPVITIKKSSIYDPTTKYSDNKYDHNYPVGKEITYNGIKYYVISNPLKTDNYVKLLKAEPLTVEEVNLYGGVGTENNHVNRYTRFDYRGSAYSYNGDYGRVAYYSSENCGYPDDSPNYNGSYVDSGCKLAYKDSDIKYIVDAWSNDKINANDIAESSRLITIDDLNSLGNSDEVDINDSVVPSFIYENNFYYWTMTPSEFGWTASIYFMTSSGLGTAPIFNEVNEIRPVVTLYKSALE